MAETPPVAVAESQAATVTPIEGVAAVATAPPVVKAEPVLGFPGRRAIWANVAANRREAGGGFPEVSDADLSLIETRCRLKTEGARWAAQRSLRLGEGADFYTEIEPVDREIIQKAKQLPDCFLWMCHPSAPSPSDLAEWDDVAGWLRSGGQQRRRDSDIAGRQ